MVEKWERRLRRNAAREGPPPIVFARARNLEKEGQLGDVCSLVCAKNAQVIANKRDGKWLILACLRIRVEAAPGGKAGAKRSNGMRFTLVRIAYFTYLITLHIYSIVCELGPPRHAHSCALGQSGCGLHRRGYDIPAAARNFRYRAPTYQPGRRRYLVGNGKLGGTYARGRICYALRMPWNPPDKGDRP